MFNAPLADQEKQIKRSAKRCYLNYIVGDISYRGLKLIAGDKGNFSFSFTTSIDDYSSRGK